MPKEALYSVCRMPLEALEAWDPNQVDPIIVYGPASLSACLILYRSQLSGDHFLVDEKGEPC